jgi:PAS domain-containing protein
MAAGFHDRIRSEFNFAVSDGKHPLYVNLPDRAYRRGTALSAEQTFSVHNRRWRFSASPRASVVAGVEGWANRSILVFGLALSGALSTLLHAVMRRMKLYREARDRALREILEREKAQQEVLASEARYRSVFDSATEGLLVVDDDRRIVEANPVACRSPAPSTAPTFWSWSRRTTAIWSRISSEAEGRTVSDSTPCTGARTAANSTSRSV